MIKGYKSTSDKRKHQCYTGTTIALREILCRSGTVVPSLHYGEQSK